jgi:hypothetical protein
MEPLAPPA